MILDITKYPEGHYHHTLKESPNRIGLESFGDTKFVGELLYEIDIRKHGTTCALNITMRGTAMLTCVRCLDIFMDLVEAKFSLLVLIRPEVNKDEEEDRIMTRSGKVNISERSRDEMILALPRYPLCSPDCKGLCPVCGINLNKESCEHNAK